MPEETYYDFIYIYKWKCSIGRAPKAVLAQKALEFFIRTRYSTSMRLY